MECRYCILERTYFTFPCFLVIETEADLYENDSVIGAYDEIYFVSSWGSAIGDFTLTEEAYQMNGYYILKYQPGR